MTPEQRATAEAEWIKSPAGQAAIRERARQAQELKRTIADARRLGNLGEVRELEQELRMLGSKNLRTFGAAIEASQNQPARPYSVAALRATRAAGIPPGQTPVIQRIANWLTARGENDVVQPGEAKKVAAFHKAAANMHQQAGQAEAANLHLQAAGKWESSAGASISAGPSTKLTIQQAATKLAPLGYRYKRSEQPKPPTWAASYVFEKDGREVVLTAVQIKKMVDASASASQESTNVGASTMQTATAKPAGMSRKAAYLSRIAASQGGVAALAQESFSDKTAVLFRVPANMVMTATKTAQAFGGTVKQRGDKVEILVDSSKAKNLISRMRGVGELLSERINAGASIAAGPSRTPQEQAMIDNNRQLWQNLRNYLYPMTPDELKREHQMAVEKGDQKRAALIKIYAAEDGVKLAAGASISAAVNGNQSKHLWVFPDHQKAFGFFRTAEQAGMKPLFRERGGNSIVFESSDPNLLRAAAKWAAKWGGGPNVKPRSDAGASISAAAIDTRSKQAQSAIKKVLGNDPPNVRQAVSVLKSQGTDGLLAWARENYGNSVVEELRRNGVQVGWKPGQGAGASIAAGPRFPPLTDQDAAANSHVLVSNAQYNAMVGSQYMKTVWPKLRKARSVGGAVVYGTPAEIAQLKAEMAKSPAAPMPPQKPFKFGLQTAGDLLRQKLSQYISNGEIDDAIREAKSGGSGVAIAQRLLRGSNAPDELFQALARNLDAIKRKPAGMAAAPPFAKEPSAPPAKPEAPQPPAAPPPAPEPEPDPADAPLGMSRKAKFVRRMMAKGGGAGGQTAGTSIAAASGQQVYFVFSEIPGGAQSFLRTLEQLRTGEVAELRGRNVAAVTNVRDLGKLKKLAEMYGGRQTSGGKMANYPPVEAAALPPGRQGFRQPGDDGSPVWVVVSVQTGQNVSKPVTREMAEKIKARLASTGGTYEIKRGSRYGASIGALQAISAAISSRNTSYGFYGTARMNGLPDAMLARVFNQVATSIAAKFGLKPEQVRDFLDSRDGRHLADAMVVEGKVKPPPAWLGKQVKTFFRTYDPSAFEGMSLAVGASNAGRPGVGMAISRGSAALVNQAIRSLLEADRILGRIRESDTGVVMASHNIGKVVAELKKAVNAVVPQAAE